MLEIKPFSESKEVGIVGVVFSVPEGGKSSLMLTLTKNYKTLYFDVEGLAMPVFKNIPEKNKNKKNLFTVSGIDSLEDIVKFLDTPQALEYDVIVIDSISYLVGLMTAKENPAALKGNAVFGYYRDLGRHILFIMEKAKKKGINLFMTFQATSGQKGYEGTWVPKVDGNEVPDRVKELSNLMLFIEKNGFRKRVIWQDTDSSFAHTKSKSLPIDHEEKLELEGLDDFTMDLILGDRPLKKRKQPKKITEKQLKSIRNAISELSKLYKEFNIKTFLMAIDQSLEKIEDMNDVDYERAVLMIDEKLITLKKNVKPL